MKKLPFSLVAALIVASMLVAWRLEPESSGAPPSSTGAPQEVNCTTSGCHDDTSPNIGSAKTELVIEGDPHTYTPGETYTLAVRISDPGKVRFGYQLVALDNMGRNAGHFTVVDENRTQVIVNELSLTDRQYATYTYPGTEAIESGRNEWKIRWTAPPSNEGDISFFAAAVSANNDYTDKGDRVYTWKHSLSAPLISAVSAHENPEASSFFSFRGNSVAFNPELIPAESFRVLIYDLRGNRVYGSEHDFSNSFSIRVPSLSAGAYLLRIQNSHSTFSEKLIVE